MTTIKRLIYDDELDKKRLTAEGSRQPGDPRSAFEQDRARIIHSAAFRRLQSKTQVYGLGASDYYRTRLTHSLEVAQIGKAIGEKFGANPDLVEAICLAHDIGHPPFGHAGEKELHSHLDPAEAKYNEGFNGNAQNLRLLTYFERKSELYKGLNLTPATLDGLVKYPWAIGDPDGETLHSKGYYKSDRDLVAAFKLQPRKTFECEIMNWADDVAYSSHDLEDALAIGTIAAHDLLRNRDRIYRHAQRGYGAEYEQFALQNPLSQADVDQAIADVMKHCIEPGYHRGIDRIAAIKTFVGGHIATCVNDIGYKENRSAASPRYSRSLELPSDIVKRVEIYKAMVFMCVIMTAPVLTLQNAGRQVIVQLYDYFNGWKRWPKSQMETQIQLFPPDLRDRADEVMTMLQAGDELAAQQFARDYVTSLTDRFAEALWKRLYIPGDSALFTARS